MQSTSANVALSQQNQALQNAQSSLPALPPQLAGTLSGIISGLNSGVSQAAAVSLPSSLQNLTAKVLLDDQAVQSLTQWAVGV